MPAYDFRCTKCRTVFEVTRPGSDDSPLACPECGAPTKQVFHAVGVHFKGHGFHNTDHPKASSAASTATASSAEAPACPAAGDGCAGCPAAE